ncbi:MAG: 30S ribosomal protein S5 [Candidatus Kerfeldbacteria bacterium CG08_land_8_20_14_0_20_42_7]|uniref:Small ribosomal subunit protein uS5 n=1 Tax=Candidatus Kerfeldbacteria bacterium CG08_land_8_20_14_0_20_42_7 TaxID=2014245 RepID=A0A2H0YTP2_9BACT|nr:MAG: 30S ribosomal protein S5 [Candidatus Kerfeldbacteria bacterium CG08_land_8_20_14_0_20_42_7]
MNKPTSQNSKRGRPRGERQDREFEQSVIDLARVTRVVAGGKRMRFRACVVIGDQKGKVGMAVAKGADVASAVNKAVNQAKKHMITVVTVKDTIPHDVRVRFKSAELYMKPAPQGSGIIAGGAVRSVMDLAGVKNVVCKMMGSANKINNVKAVILGLSKFRKDPLALRGVVKKA